MSERTQGCVNKQRLLYNLLARPRIHSLPRRWNLNGLGYEVERCVDALNEMDRVVEVASFGDEPDLLEEKENCIRRWCM